jgi:hypothetical protein
MPPDPRAYIISTDASPLVDSHKIKMEKSQWHVRVTTLEAERNYPTHDAVAVMEMLSEMALAFRTAHQGTH